MTNKVTILAIDDEEKALNLLKLSLEISGFSVTIATDGWCGINQAIAKPPDLILLDIRMPKIDGWEVCKNLKGIKETREIPVLFLTAFFNESDKKRAKDLGVEEFITKPIDPDRLILKINQIIENTKFKNKSIKTEGVFR